MATPAEDEAIQRAHASLDRMEQRLTEQENILRVKMQGFSERELIEHLVKLVTAIHDWAEVKGYLDYTVLNMPEVDRKLLDAYHRSQD